MEATALGRLRGRPRRAAFAGVFASVLCGFLGIGAVLPVLPRYVHGPLGAGDVAVGIVMGAFAFSAIVGRPVAGRLADARGRRAILVAGLAIVGAGGALCLVHAGVAGLVAARLVLGLGEGLMFTAGSAWVVDLAPVERRGQTIGLFGLAVWGGLSAGPVIGELLLSLSSYATVFAFAAAAPCLGAALAARVGGPHAGPGRAAGAPRGPLVPRASRRPGSALALANVGYGTVAGFVVLHLSARGVGHGAAVFTAFAVSIVATRLVAGRLPDRLGTGPTVLGAFLVEAAGLALLALAHDTLVAGAGGVVMGAGFSLLFPSLALLVIEGTEPDRRGAAMGAFTAFSDLGIGVGAPLAGAVAALWGYPAAFWGAAGLAVAGGLLGGLSRADGRGDGRP